MRIRKRSKVLLVMLCVAWGSLASAQNIFTIAGFRGATAPTLTDNRPERAAWRSLRFADRQDYGEIAVQRSASGAAPGTGRIAADARRLRRSGDTAVRWQPAGRDPGQQSDADGALYLSDEGRGRVPRVARDGTVTPSPEAARYRRAWRATAPLRPPRCSCHRADWYSTRRGTSILTRCIAMASGASLPTGLFHRV